MRPRTKIVPGTGTVCKQRQGSKRSGCLPGWKVSSPIPLSLQKAPTLIARAKSRAKAWPFCAPAGRPGGSVMTLPSITQNAGALMQENGKDGAQVCGGALPAPDGAALRADDVSPAPRLAAAADRYPLNRLKARKAVKVADERARSEKENLGENASQLSFQKYQRIAWDCGDGARFWRTGLC